MKIPKPQKYSKTDELIALRHIKRFLEKENCTGGWIYREAIEKIKKLEGAIK